MSEHCFEIEELARIAKLPADDPGRAHLANCPRCRAHLTVYEDFMRAEMDAEKANPQNADERLTATLQKEIFGTEELPVQPARRDAPRVSWWQQLVGTLTRPALRPVWGVAAAVLIVLAAREIVFPNRVPESGQRVLRGTEERASQYITANVRFESDGMVAFTWASNPESDRCEIAFYGIDLAEIGRLDGGPGTELRVSSDELPIDVDHPGVFWRVIYLRSEDEIDQSPLVKLPTSE